MTAPTPKPSETEPVVDPDTVPVAGKGLTQGAVDAAEQELETPEDTTNEGSSSAFRPACSGTG